MKPLLLLLALALSACSSASSPSGRGTAQGAGEAEAQPLRAEGTPLRALVDPEPGPEGEDPPCTSFAPAATCTRIGALTWVLQADGGSWQLTAYGVDEERSRWVPALQGSGGGLSPTVTEVDLTDAEQPETLVVYGGSFDLVSTGEAGAPEVVVHGDGQASVEDDAVVAGDRRVEQQEGRWVAVPAA